MLTPIEIQGKTFKNGRGYKKEEIDEFLRAVGRDYEILYKENLEYKDKLNTLTEGLAYYKSIENTLQKALVLAEKTSNDTTSNAEKKAEAIEEKARIKAENIEAEAKAEAEKILSDSRKELSKLEVKLVSMAQEYEKYRAQFRQMAKAQIELLDGAAYQIDFKAEDINTTPIQKEKEGGISLFLQDAKRVKEQKAEPFDTSSKTAQEKKPGSEIHKEVESGVSTSVNASEDEIKTDDVLSQVSTSVSTLEDETKTDDVSNEVNNYSNMTESTQSEESNLFDTADSVLKTESVSDAVDMASDVAEEVEKIESVPSMENIPSDSAESTETAEESEGQTLNEIFERLKSKTDMQENEITGRNSAPIDTTDVWTPDLQGGSPDYTFYQTDNMKFTHVKKENPEMEETTDFEFIKEEDS